MVTFRFNPNFETNPNLQGKVHPEQGTREFYLGQFNKGFIESTLKKKWLRLRVGTIAFDENGVAYPNTVSFLAKSFPVFVDRNDAINDYNKLYPPAKLLA